MPYSKSLKFTPPKVEVTQKNLIQFTQILTRLREQWKPHSGQKKIWDAIFDGYRSIFIQCGRKFGKTEIAIDILWMFARWFPSMPCYYIAPLQTQAREIVWADPRMQNHGPQDWLLKGSKGINESQMRINFITGSFIKVDGSDNYNKYRGPRFKVCVYDEYKEHRPEFRRAMRPNASVLDGIEIFMGSPPDRECDYTVLAEEHRTDPKKFFISLPTETNPFIPKEWLDVEKERLYRLGEGDEWEREYMARFVPGGVSKIFPMLERSRVVVPHDQMIKDLSRDMRKLQYFVTADPAASSVFAVLFGAFNPYSKKWYLFDEIYETDQAKMSVNMIGMRINSMRQEIYDRAEWIQTYDEAESWFKNEMFDRFNEFWQPTQKAVHKKEHGLSLIKDIMLQKNIVMSDRCVKLFWELDNYFKDKNNRIPKANDHLIDCLRYKLAASYYDVVPQKEYKEIRDENFRGARVSDDFDGVNDFGDPIDSLSDGSDELGWEDYDSF